MTKEKIEALGKEISEKLNKTDANYIFVAMPDTNVKDYFFALKFNDNGKFVSMLFAVLQTYIKTQGENPIEFIDNFVKAFKEYANNAKTLPDSN